MTAPAPPVPAANPNETVNGYCSRCRDWAVRSRTDTCMWCDAPLKLTAAAPSARRRRKAAR